MEVTVSSGDVVVVQKQIVPGTNDSQWVVSESRFPRALWEQHKASLLKGAKRVG
jgi:hypothetical protein